MEKYNIRFISLSILLLSISATCYIACRTNSDTSIRTSHNLPNISYYPNVGTNQNTFCNNITTMTALKD